MRSSLDDSAMTLYIWYHLAERTAQSMIGYWHDKVACLSVRPSVSNAVHCG